MWRWLSTLLVMTMLQSCSFTSGPLTIKAAVEQQLLMISSRRSVSVPEIRITKPVGSGVLALYTHDIDSNGQRLMVSGVFYLERRGLNWVVLGGSRGGDQQLVPLPPIEFQRGGSGGLEGDTVYVYGLVNDAAVRQVAVTWSDGTREVVSVENGAYLAVKQGQADAIMVEALDAQGNVLHTQSSLFPGSNWLGLAR